MNELEVKQSGQSVNEDHAAILERVLLHGDLSKLSGQERLVYYKQICSSMGLSPLTRPFEYIVLNNKLTLYAKKDCTDQLRKIHRVSVTIPAREMIGDVYVVTARATLPDGRCDEATGAVALGNLKGDMLANAYLRSETKAKRRVTLSICGLGLLDETEVDSIPGVIHATPMENQAKEVTNLHKAASITETVIKEANLKLTTPMPSNLTGDPRKDFPNETPYQPKLAQTTTPDMHRNLTRPTTKQLGRLFAIQKKNGWTGVDVSAFLRKNFKAESAAEISIHDYNSLCNHIEAFPKQEQKQSSIEEPPPHTDNDFAPSDPFPFEK